jgi:acetyl esterase/lipase
VAVRDETNFLAETAGLPDDLQLLPGLTVAEARAHLARPAHDPLGGRFIPSVAYSTAAGDIGQMALYARADSSERAPMVLFVHGGGWTTGHHYGAFRYLHPLATDGYVAATVTYRFADEAPWPAALEDVKCAVRWLRHHATEVGGDPDRIVIAGDSAGGHLAALTALEPGKHEGDGGWSDVSSEVQSAVLFYPAVDLAAMVAESVHEPMAGYFGGAIAAASPVNRVMPSCPPVLTLTGDADTTTRLEHIRRFHAQLEEAGVQQRLQVFPGRGHGFDLVPSDFNRCLPLIQEFLAQTVGEP